jgi:hypothetical protein
MGILIQESRHYLHLLQITANCNRRWVMGDGCDGCGTNRHPSSIADNEEDTCTFTIDASKLTKQST